MMNSSVILKQTRKMAEALTAFEQRQHPERVHLAYERIFGRARPRGKPGLDFLQRCSVALKSEANAKARHLRAWQSLPNLLASNEFIGVE